jgi:hypothetical protein
MQVKPAPMDYRTARTILDALPDDHPAHAALAAAEAEREWADDYYNSNEESPLAEYVGSAGYSGEMAHEIADRVRDNRDEWSPAVCAWILAQLGRAAHRSTVGDLLDFTTLASRGIFYGADELCSAAVGECEHQISDDLAAQVAALAPDVQAAVAELAGLRGDTMYVGDDYTRWVLVLSVDDLEAHLAAE